jgi:hypothetical protein
MPFMTTWTQWGLPVAAPGPRRRSLVGLSRKPGQSASSPEALTSRGALSPE